MHASYQYSQLFDVEVDQASHNRLEIDYIIENKVDNCGVGNLF